MKIIYNNTNSTVRFALISLISCFFLSFFFSLSCSAQNDKKDIELMFVKSNDSIKSADLYFNALKIWNNSPKPVVGNVQFNGPENWKIISFPSEQTIVNPGDTLWIPVRVSPSANTLGGIAYIINATFRTRKQIVSANTYLTLPPITKWEFSTNTENLYFTEDTPNPTFKIRLSNKGNTSELIKLDLKVGKLLKFNNGIDNDYVEYVNLPAFRDTTILHNISYQTKLNYAEKIRYENNWRESSVQVTASTDKTEQSSAFQIKKYNSSYINQRAQSASPLNIEYQMYNLMSSQPIRNNFKVYGSLLFSKNRELQYLTALQNINFEKGGNSNFDIDRQLLYNLRYTDSRNYIQLGYNINGGVLHTINGRGITGSYSFKNNSKISYAVSQNLYSKMIGENLMFGTNIKSISLITGVTHESKESGGYDATSVLLGTGFSPFKHHSLTLQFLGSKAAYSQTIYNDTSVLGYSYKVNYNVKYDKFSLRISSMNSQHNYIRNSGLQQTYLDGKYTLNNRIAFSFYGNRQLYANSRYPYNFYNPVNYNSTDNLRIVASLSDGNIVYQIGPNYNGSNKQTYNSVSGFKSQYITYQPGVWLATTIKLGGYRSITPNFTINNARFYYITDDDPGLHNQSSNKNIFYSAGINYFDNFFRVNAYYSSGSVSDMFRSVLVEGRPVTSRSIQFRPYYENYFFDRKVKLSAYANYAYYMPSGRENVSYNLKYDQFLRDGWSFSVSGFMYSNVKVTDDAGRFATKDLNFMLGVSKSFNIQQPRLKYYDFKSVFFNDLDGDRIKSENEPPVKNILVNVTKDRSASLGKSTIQEINLISNTKGEVAIENLPKDNYRLSFKPINNLQSLYFLNGSEESYFNGKSNTLYIPLAESYKIKGKIILIRDPNSSEGKIDLGGIRITAVGPKGETYAELTDNSGAFVLSVPNAEKYTVHINNVFGEHFNIDANEVQVQFAENKTISLDFTFMEVKREIQFDNGGELFKFSTFDEEADMPVPVVDTLQNKPVQVVVPQNYAIKLGSSKTYVDPTFYKNKYKLRGSIVYTENNGVYDYYTGEYSNLKDAKAAITKLKINGSAVSVDRNLLKEAKPITKPIVKSQPKVIQPVVEKKKPIEKVSDVILVDSVKRNPVETPIINQPTELELIDSTRLYTIQIDASRDLRDPKYYKEKYNLPFDVTFIDDEKGMRKYYAGSYKSIAKARADIARYGLTGSIVPITESIQKKEGIQEPNK